jgi:hypothetical protein
MKHKVQACKILSRDGKRNISNDNNNNNNNVEYLGLHFCAVGERALSSVLDSMFQVEIATIIFSGS